MHWLLIYGLLWIGFLLFCYVLIKIGDNLDEVIIFLGLDDWADKKEEELKRVYITTIK